MAEQSKFSGALAALKERPAEQSAGETLPVRVPTRTDLTRGEGEAARQTK